MSDKHDFKSNMDAGGADGGAEEKGGNGLLGGFSNLTHAAQDAVEEAHRPHSVADSLKGLAEAAQEAVKQGDKTTVSGSSFGGAADAAAAAQAAAEAAQRLREQAQAQQQSQDQAQNPGWVTSGVDDDFVGSGGVGSEDQLDAIRRGYAERGMADPSGLGHTTDAAFESNLDATASGGSSGSGGSDDSSTSAALDSSSSDDFVGSGGVSSDMLDEIRRGYAERGMDDPSGSSNS